MAETLEEVISKRRAARGDASPASVPQEDNSLEGVIARRRAEREAESAPVGPAPVDTARAAKDTEWLDKQQAAQTGLPLELYKLLKPAGEYTERVQGGYHGLEAPKGSGILAPERIGNIAGTVQDVGAGVGGGLLGAPVAGPFGAAVGYGGGTALSQYARTAGYRPNAGQEALVSGGIAAVSGPLLKGLGVAARGIAPTAARVLERPLSGVGGQAALGTLLGGGQQLAQGRDPTDVLEGAIAGGLSGGLGAKLARSLPGGIGERLQAGDTATEAAAAGVRAPGAPEPTGGGGTPLPPLLSAALPYGRTGRMVRAAARTMGGRYQQGGEEQALAAKLFDQLQPGEEWTPDLKSGAPLERGSATGPNQPNRPIPGAVPFPGPVPPTQPPMGRAMGPYEDVLSPNTLIRSNPAEPSLLDVPRAPAGLAAPELPYSNPETAFPALMKPNVLGGRGPLPGPAGPMARSSRFPPNPSAGPIPSEPLESTFPGGIQRFQKPPAATPQIEAERAAVKAALRKAAREGLEGEGPPEAPPPAPKPPKRPSGPAPGMRAPPATIESKEVPGVPAKSPTYAPTNAPAPPPAAEPTPTPKAPAGAYYEGRGGKVLRVTGNTVETLGEGGKVLNSQEITDRVKGIGGILGSSGARKVRDPAKIQELLARGSAPEAPAKAETPAKSAEGPLSPTHEARKAALEEPYPEEPGKTYADKFHEVVREFMGGKKKLLARVQHQGHGQPEKRGVYEDREYFVREAPASMSGKPPRGHDPKSGTWIVDKSEVEKAGEGAGNEFRRKLSPFSADVLKDTEGNVLYQGPPVEGSSRAQEKLKATEPEKSAAAVDKEADLKARMAAETDPDKKFELMQEWEAYRKEKGLGTAGGKVQATEQPETRELGGYQTKDYISPEGYKEQLAKLAEQEPDEGKRAERVTKALAKVGPELHIRVDNRGDAALREAIRLAMQLSSHPGSNVKQVTILDRDFEPSITMNRVGAPPPYVRPETVPTRNVAPLRGSASVDSKTQKLFLDMVAKGEPGELQIAKGVKIEFRPYPKKKD